MHHRCEACPQLYLIQSSISMSIFISSERRAYKVFRDFFCYDNMYNQNEGFTIRKLKGVCLFTDVNDTADKFFALRQSCQYQLACT
jgi:hypothetical protein